MIDENTINHLLPLFDKVLYISFDILDNESIDLIKNEITNNKSNNFTIYPLGSDYIIYITPFNVDDYKITNQFYQIYTYAQTKGLSVILITRHKQNLFTVLNMVTVSTAHIPKPIRNKLNIESNKLLSEKSIYPKDKYGWYMFTNKDCPDTPITLRLCKYIMREKYHADIICFDTDANTIKDLPVY